MNTRRFILGAAAAIGLGSLVWFLLQPDPAAVLRAAQGKLARTKSLRYELTGTLRGQAGELVEAATGTAGVLAVAVRVDLDRSNPLHPASTSSFSFSIGEGEAARSLAGSAVKKDGTHFLRLEKAEALGDMDTSKLLGTWVRAGRPFLELLAPPGTLRQGERPLDSKGYEQIIQAFSAVDLFRVTEVLPAERIDGVKARRYAVELNVETATALRLKLHELGTGVPVTQEEALLAATEVAQWGTPKGEIWIGKRDGKVRKLTLSTTLPDAGSTKVQGTLLFSRYDQPVRVERPEAVPLEELLGEAAGRLSLAGERQAPAPAEKGTSSLPVQPQTTGLDKDTDDDGLSDGQENFYGADAWNPDTDGDGWADGREVENGMDPVGPGALFGFGL
jgi:hypothetical protein